ncbi:DEAD/DEAH box helicase [Gammaproteobacteria bacterium]
MTDTLKTPRSDPLLLDQERLQAIASAAAVRDGLAYFKDHRVTEVDGENNRLWGTVEDEDGLDHAVEVRHDDTGELTVVCGCEEGGVYRHAVALLLAFEAHQASDTRFLSAQDAALDERLQKGRTEVRATPLLDDGRGFGAWQAASVTSTTHYPQTYRVQIRSLHGRRNFCTCPDFAHNQLGTCKHIEAALHQIRKRPDYQTLERQSSPSPFVYLAWDVENPPRIRLQRTSRMDPDLLGILDRYFDAEGFFKGRLPDDFFRFGEAVYERAHFDLGEDAEGYVKRLSAAAAQRSRAAEIRARIGQSGGVLPGIRARLYPYQVEGVAFLAANGRALLADDMGLGKTLQAIAAAHWLQQQADARRVLVVCPASLKHQWAREIQKFTGEAAQIIQGGAEARGVQYRREVGYFIINYELVMRDLTLINQTLRPDLLILDEAQRIKNWRTKVASAVKLVPSRYAFVLTGTPLENRLEDLYSLMQVVDPGVLGPLWRYLAEFHVTDERGKVLGYRNLAALRQRLVPVMLRRDRRLVRDQLPDRIEQRLDVPMTLAQRNLHDDALNNAGRLAQIARRRPLTPSEQNRLMAALQQARMACNAAGLVDKETEGAPKIDELAHLLEELCLQSGLKAVVFSQWERMTAFVEQRLKRMGVGSVRLHGGVPSARRGELLDRFHEDDALQVFISTDAGGVGLNLQCASVLINLDMPWNPAVLDQRIARIHRLGQTRKTQVILLVAEDSYEERVLSLVQGKRDLFDNVVDPDAQEDVVGLSRKLLNTLVEDLAKTTSAAPDQAVALTGEAEPPPPTVVIPSAPAPAGPEDSHTDDESVRTTLTAIQARFGARLHRVMGAGGGLMVVVTHVETEDDAFVERLSERLPVALLDLRTVRSLDRIGLGLGETTRYFNVGQTPAPESRLRQRAREQLQAAEVLLAQQCHGPAVELLLAAMLSSAAEHAGRHQPLSPQEAGVWLYAEALPQALLSPEQGHALMRALALSQTPQVPAVLAQAVWEDAKTWVSGP